jgi:hypothetical protein
MRITDTFDDFDAYDKFKFDRPSEPERNPEKTKLEEKVDSVAKFKFRDPGIPGLREEEMIRAVPMGLRAPDRAKVDWEVEYNKKDGVSGRVGGEFSWELGKESENSKEDNDACNDRPDGYDRNCNENQKNEN